MGQKVNPVGIRLGIVKDWHSKWYASSKDYSNYLLSDIAVRDFLFKELASASVSRISIERLSNTAKVIIHTARPGIVIGKKGADIEKLKNIVSDKMGIPVHISIEEVKQPELDARLVAENIAQQLEKRVMYRRAVKRVLGNATRLGALGIKIMVSGRLNGAEIARSEWYREGRVPLHTFRADVDYSSFRANTQYGVIDFGSAGLQFQILCPAKNFQVRDIRLVKLGNMRHIQPASMKVFCTRLSDAAERSVLDFTPLREVHLRYFGYPRTARRAFASDPCFDKFVYVFLENPVLTPRACHFYDVNPIFPGLFPYGWPSVNTSGFRFLILIFAGLTV